MYLDEKRIGEEIKIEPWRRQVRKAADVVEMHHVCTLSALAWVGAGPTAWERIMEIIVDPPFSYAKNGPIRTAEMLRAIATR
jgi:hypothetical protein